MGRVLIALIIACAALCMAASVDAIVCTANICSIVKCDNSVTPENCNGDYEPYGGFCGCCPLCVTFIPPGGQCLVLNGVPQSTRCVEGTYCINGTCQAPCY